VLGLKLKLGFGLGLRLGFKLELTFFKNLCDNNEHQKLV